LPRTFSCLQLEGRVATGYFKTPPGDAGTTSSALSSILLLAVAHTVVENMFSRLSLSSRTGFYGDKFLTSLSHYTRLNNDPQNVCILRPLCELGTLHIEREL
jgi:hypothetical protein